MKKLILLVTALLLLTLPWAALGEGGEDAGVILYDGTLRPLACFLPGAPMADAGDWAGNQLLLAAGWRYAAFPSTEGGPSSGYTRDDWGEAASPERFPTATVLRDFALESPNAMLGWPEGEALLRAGDTVYLLGMDATRWYVYADGHYGSVPKVIYDMDFTQPAEGYLAVDEAAAARLKAMLPQFAVSAEEYRLMRNSRDEQEAAALETYGSDRHLWPWAVQLSVAEANWNVGFWNDAEVVAPTPEDLTEEQAVADARALAAEVLGDAFPSETCRVGATFQWDGDRGQWHVWLVSEEDRLEVISRPSGAVFQRDDSLHSFDVACALADWFAAQDARWEELDAERGAWMDWTLEEKQAFDPDSYALPDARCVSAEAAVNAAKEAAVAEGLLEDVPTLASVNFLRFPAGYASELPGVYDVQLFLEDSSYCCAAYVNPLTGAVIMLLTGNG